MEVREEGEMEEGAMGLSQVATGEVRVVEGRAEAVKEVGMVAAEKEVEMAEEAKAVG